MTLPIPPEGLIGSILGNLIPDLTKILPKPISDAITETVGKILDPNDPSVNPGDPQPAGPPPIPTQDPGVLADAVKVIDAVLGGIALIQKFSFIIPDQYEPILTKLAEALTTVRGWLV